MAATTQTIEQVEQATGKYKYGFVTQIESDKAPKGLSKVTSSGLVPKWAAT